MKISPLASKEFPRLPPIRGVRLAAGECNIRYKNRPDVLVVELASGTTVAGVFTTSLTAAAPVLACKDRAKKGMARALVVNAGNANAFTGAAGEESMARISRVAASLFSCRTDDVFLASTGVIGEILPDERITKKPSRYRRKTLD